MLICEKYYTDTTIPADLFGQLSLLPIVQRTIDNNYR